MSAARLQGLVLAGGASRRMGRDKAALEVNGVTLLERAVTLLESLVGDVFVGVRAPDTLRKTFHCIPDSIAGGGPGAGILSAHIAYPECAWLVMACDMPRVGPRMLQELLAARDPGATATCWAGADGEPEPLCAVYEPATLAAFLQSVKGGGHNSPRRWLANCEPKILQPRDADALRSTNTPQEWQELTNWHE